MKDTVYPRALLLLSSQLQMPKFRLVSQSKKIPAIHPLGLNDKNKKMKPVKENKKNINFLVIITLYSKSYVVLPCFFLLDILIILII